MSICDNCSIDLSVARIQQNWNLLGPLTQISKNVGLPQGVIEIIGSYLAIPHHTVTFPVADREYENVTLTICRYCLAAGLTTGLLEHRRLPYLRVHIELFISKYKSQFFWSKYIKDFAHQCELPENYNCSYYRTKRPMIREGLRNLITSS